MPSADADFPPRRRTGCPGAPHIAAMLGNLLDGGLGDGV